ncbi:MAG TPA: hypothetical protein VN540_01820 [Clostridia bacterium]|nr:hypothetical protein [Clostridia bacterium]
MKRIFALFLALAMLALLGCAKQAETRETQAPDATATPEPGVDANGEDFPLLGLIVDDDGSDGAYMTMYGFLHTAETLGYAAKLYRAKAGAETLAAVAKAAEDGVDGLMISSPGGANDAAVTEAAQKGMFVVVPYDTCAVDGLDCNVVADDTDYYDELARGLAERMTERSLKSGRILVYGRDTATCLLMFQASIAASYPQFSVVSFQRTAADEQGAIDELAQFLLYNRDVKGMYAIDADSSAIAVGARTKAQQQFRQNGAPSPTPSLTPDPNATPGDPNATVYTPNPGILTQISVTVFCSGLSDDNYGLFTDNDIFALCIEPYYEAAAQGTMTLDELIRGESVAGVAKVNRPLVYADTAEKYKAIYDQMKAAFSLNENG